MGSNWGEQVEKPLRLPHSLAAGMVHIEAGYCGPPNGGQSVHSSSFPCKMIHPSVIPRMKQQGAFTCNRVHGM
jgi:hypothetical protein